MRKIYRIISIIYVVASGVLLGMLRDWQYFGDIQLFLNFSYLIYSGYEMFAIKKVNKKKEEEQYDIYVPTINITLLNLYMLSELYRSANM